MLARKFAVAVEDLFSEEFKHVSAQRCHFSLPLHYPLSAKLGGFWLCCETHKGTFVSGTVLLSHSSGYS